MVCSWFCNKNIPFDFPLYSCPSKSMQKKDKIQVPTEIIIQTGTRKIRCPFYLNHLEEKHIKIKGSISHDKVHCIHVQLLLSYFKCLFPLLTFLFTNRLVHYFLYLALQFDKLWYELCFPRISHNVFLMHRMREKSLRPL